jgi:transposase
MGKVFEFVIKESVSELKMLRKKERNEKKKLRLLSLILTKEEKFERRVDLAKFLDVDVTTLNNWVSKYRKNGLKGILESKSGGKRRESVPKSIHQEIETKLNDSKNPLQGYTDAVLWIEKEFGFQLKYHTVRAFMVRNFGTKLKIPRKSHYKRDEEAFEAFKKIQK